MTIEPIYLGIFIYYKYCSPSDPYDRKIYPLRQTLIYFIFPVAMDISLRKQSLTKRLYFNQMSALLWVYFKV